jgi:hypothetical protein
LDAILIPHESGGLFFIEWERQPIPKSENIENANVTNPKEREGTWEIASGAAG